MQVYIIFLILIALPTDLGQSLRQKKSSEACLNKQTIKSCNPFFFLFKQRGEFGWKRVAVHTHFSTYVERDSARASQGCG